MGINVENIFQAVDVILSKRLEDISYDETIICTITNADNSKNGEYYVTNGSINFLAYSDSDRYRANDQVRVQIPKGDYSQKKFIVGKFVNDNETTPLTYVSPLDTVVALDSFSPADNNQNTQYGISVCDKGKATEHIIWSKQLTDEQIDVSNEIYNTITLQGDFRTLFNGLNMVSGVYGLRLHIGVKPNANSEKIIEFICDFNSKELFGNPYSFAVYTTQAKTFNFNASGIVSRLQLALYQDGNFKNSNGKELCTHGTGTEDKHIETNPQILIKDIKIGFGSNVEKISDNVLKLFTQSSLNYTQHDNARNLELLWYNKDDNNRYLGFSDGVYDPDYDEITYLTETAKETRLINQKGQEGVPEDATSLELAANINEATPIINKVKNYISGDLYRTINEFELQLKVNVLKNLLRYNSEEENDSSKLDIKGLVTNIEENLSKAQDMYKNVLAFGYNTWKQKETGDFPTIEENFGYNICSIIVNNIIEEIKSRLTSIKTKITETTTLKHYQSIYDSYEYRLNNIFTKILAILRMNEDYLFINEEDFLVTFFEQSNSKKIIKTSDYDRLKEYETKTDYSEYISTIETENYNNKYSIYWFKYNKNYKPINEVVSLGDGWQRLSDWDNFGRPGPGEAKDGVTYLAQKSSADAAKVSLELDKELVQEKFKVILFYNHQKFESNEIIFENTDPLIDVLTLDQGKALVIEHGNNSKDNYQIYHNITKQLYNVRDLTLNRTLICHYNGLTKGDEAFEGATVYWYVPPYDTMLDVDIDALVGKGFSTDAYIVKLIAELTEEYKYVNEDTCSSHIKEQLDKLGLSENYLIDNKFANIDNLYTELNNLLSDNSKPGYYCFYRKIIVTKNIENEITSYQYTDEKGIDTREFYYKLQEFYSTNRSRNEILCEVELQTETLKTNASADEPVQGIESSDIIDAQNLAAARLFTFGLKESNGTQYTFQISPMGQQTAVNSDKADLIELKVQLFDYEDQLVEINNSLGFNTEESQLLDLNSNELLDLTKEETSPIVDLMSKGNIIGISVQGGYGIIKAKISQSVETTTDDNTISSRSVELSTEYAIPKGQLGYRLSGPTHIVYNDLGTIDNSDYYNDAYKLYQKNEDGSETLIDVEWSIRSSASNQDSSDYMPKIVNNKLIPAPLYLDGITWFPIIVATLKESNEDEEKNEIIWEQPIIVTQNRYQSNLLNGWDGSMIIDEENNYLLTAMIGAGKKNSDNTFSGVFMGDVVSSENTNLSTGLFGYNYGAQSFGFDINGTAFIGKAGRGRLLFDGNNATIQSAGYNENGQGMIIDFDNAFIDMRDIYYDNNDEIYKTNNKSHIRIDVKSPYFKIATTTVNEVDKGLIYIGDDGYYLQSANYKLNESGTKYNLQDGSIDSKYFKVDPNGKIVATAGDIAGWSFDNRFLYKLGKQITENEIDDNGNQVEVIRQEAIAFDVAGIGQNSRVFKIGKIDTIEGSWGRFDDGFAVDGTGKLYANNAVIQGKVITGEGEIGGWLIQENRIEKGSWEPNEWSSNNSYLSFFASTPQGAYSEQWGTRNWLLYLHGGKCGVDELGNLYATGATISGTIYASSGEFTGIITANDGGNIGGFEITKNKYLTADGVGIGTSGNSYAFWAGKNYLTEGDTPPFYVTHDGVVQASQAILGTRSELLAVGESGIYISSGANGTSVGISMGGSSTAQIHYDQVFREGQHIIRSSSQTAFYTATGIVIYNYGTFDNSNYLNAPSRIYNTGSSNYLSGTGKWYYDTSDPREETNEIASKSWVINYSQTPYANSSGYSSQAGYADQIRIKKYDNISPGKGDILEIKSISGPDTSGYYYVELGV